MKMEKLEVVRGSRNVFRDLGHKNADAQQFKEAAKYVLALTETQIAELLKRGDFVEVKNNEQKVSK